MKKYAMGVDPGKAGAITFLDLKTRELEMHLFPRTGVELDIQGIYKILKDKADEVAFGFLEDVHAIFNSSAKATFGFGRAVGHIQAALDISGVPYELIQPKSWQKIAWTDADLVQHPTKRKYKRTGLPIMKTDSKATSLNAAKRIFPNESFLPSPRHRTHHDGLYDSALIAHVATRLNSL